MAIPEYEPFDYFYTPTHEFRWRKDLLEKYGLTEGEIIQYEANMVADRNRWHEKHLSFDRWKFFVLIIAAVLTFIGVLVTKWLLCMLLNIEKGSLGMKLISNCSTIVIISIIWGLWSKEITTEWIDAWIEYKYKMRTQHNIFIEKYLEDCHWEWYNKFMKPLYERDEPLNKKNKMK